MLAICWDLCQRGNKSKSANAVNSFPFSDRNKLKSAKAGETNTSHFFLMEQFYFFSFSVQKKYFSIKILKCKSRREKYISFLSNGIVSLFPFFLQKNLFFLFNDRNNSKNAKPEEKIHFFFLIK